MNSDFDLVSTVALSMIQGIGGATSRQLISHLGTPHNVLNASLHDLTDIQGIGQKTALSILKNKEFVLPQAEKEVLNCSKKGVNILYISDKEYPRRLRQYNDAPILLYYQGNANLNASKIVSIVGTRNSSRYGETLTEELVQELSKLNDILIVSGLAYGIDITAHKACLKQKVPTVGVTANGLNMVYPASHKSSANQMKENGGLLTENRLNDQPDATKFPARNRIIAGMADAVVVVEAKHKGGALITAEYANEYGKDTFAYPGRTTDSTSTGCLNLIKKHKATLITNVDDLLYNMNWSSQAPQGIQKKLFISLSAEEQKIRDLLLEEGRLKDELVYLSQIPLHKLSSILLEMEFKGVIKALPGNKFILA